MTVHVVTYEWRNWSRDVLVFATLEAAIAHVVDEAREHADYTDADTDFQGAIDALNACDHSVEVDSREVLG